MYVQKRKNPIDRLFIHEFDLKKKIEPPDKICCRTQILRLEQNSVPFHTLFPHETN